MHTQSIFKKYYVLHKIGKLFPYLLSEIIPEIPTFKRNYLHEFCLCVQQLGKYYLHISKFKKVE